jgi:antitoxin HicB
MNAYPVALTDVDGTFVVRSRDLPQFVAFGANAADALANAEEALVVTLLSYMEKAMAIPVPRPAKPGEHFVYLPAPVAAKLTVWQAFQRSGLSKSELARRMGVAETEVRRILDPDYGSKLDKLDAAARALGARLVVRLETAA